MVKTLIKKILPMMLILGTVQMAVAITICLMSGANFNTYLNDMTIYDVKTVAVGTYTQTFYIFNIKIYLNSLKTNIDVLNLNMFIPNTPSGIPAPKWNDVIAILKVLVNSLLWIINWIIWLTNILLSPTKLILTIGLLANAIIGMDLSNVSVMEAIQKLYYLQIPYIVYWK